MKPKALWTAAALAALACLLPLLWLQPFGHNRPPQFAMQTDVSLTAWIYSKPVARLLSDYQAQHPEINIEIRTFRSEEQLYEELAAAVSTHMPPNMAEVGSGLGIGGLADTGQLLPVDELLPELSAAVIDPGYAEAFRYKGQRWAVPYGAVAPVLYYNENLLRLPAAREGPDGAAMSWEELAEHAARMTQDVNADGVTDIWGLVADRHALGRAVAAADEAASEAAVSRLFGIWHELVHRHKAMPALEHHLALSNFIDGTAGMLLAPSDMRNRLEEYIGGTFGFGVMSVPGIGGDGATAMRASGFAMLRSGPEIERIMLEIADYLLEADTQRRLFLETSKLPVRAGLAEQWLHAADELTERELQLLRIGAGKHRLEDEEAVSKAAHGRLLAIQEELEGSGTACVTCLSQLYLTIAAEE